VQAEGYDDDGSEMHVKLKTAVLVAGGEEIPLLTKKRVIVDL